MSPLLSAVLIAAMTAKGHDYGHILEKPVFFEKITPGVKFPSR